jgi:phosphoglycolate phosphatase
MRAATDGVRAALIDLDGTLLDTAPELAAAANATLGEFGFAPIEAALVRDFVGKGLAALVRRCLEASLGAPPDGRLQERVEERFAVYYEELNGTLAQPFPGVREGLAALRAQGLLLACVTNKVMRFTAPLLEATGLRGAFQAVVTSDTAGARKPDPEIFRYACWQLGVPPARACVIGDSANDSDGAQAAGCGFLLVPYGYREGRALEDIACDSVVATLVEAAQALRA